MAPKFLRRYTDLPALVSLLAGKQLTLLDPRTWDDSNDSHFLSVYKERKKLKTLLALCFTQASETYHHWRIFAPGPSGVCIQFNRARLLAALRGVRGMRTGSVRYLSLPKMRRKRRLKVADLPFTKRHGFGHEHEYRFIYETRTDPLPAYSVPIPLSSISRVTLSPWMHKALLANLRASLRRIDGCAKLSIARSTLIGNDEWKELGAGAR
jgi:hypothetical protein